MAKKKSKNSSVINRNKAQYNENLVKMLTILGIVLAMLIIIYIGTAIVTGEIKIKKGDKKEEVSIQSEEILAGSTFNIDDKEYLVLYYSYDAKDAGIYNMLYSNYSNNNTSIKMYKVNLDSGFNKSYVSNKVNANPSNIDELKVKSPTLIRLKNKKVIKIISSKDAIKKYINNLK